MVKPPLYVDHLMHPSSRECWHPQRKHAYSIPFYIPIQGNLLYKNVSRLLYIPPGICLSQISINSGIQKKSQLTEFSSQRHHFFTKNRNDSWQKTTGSDKICHFRWFYEPLGEKKLL